MAKNDRGSAAREKAAELRAEAERSRRQRRLLIIAGAGFVVVLLVLGTFVLVSRQGTSQPADTAAGSEDFQKALSVSAATLDAAGAPQSPSGIEAIAGGSPRLSDGTPTVTYVGGEFCPYCATQRWVLVSALSRFGSFQGLKASRSAEDDGDIPTVTFVDATYTSDYLTLEAFETTDRDHQALQKLTPEVETLFSRNNPQGSIPWTYLGTSQLIGSQVSPAEFTGGAATASSLTQKQVAEQMATGTSPLGTAINSQTNALTAQLCTLTDNKPENVCTAKGVTAAKAAT